ncbi:hypothetical protein OHD60_18795 [Escherichia coli]|nr:hypothetical protein [Escherichia coli]
MKTVLNYCVRKEINNVSIQLMLYFSDGVCVAILSVDTGMAAMALE